MVKDKSSENKIRGGSNNYILNKESPLISEMFLTFYEDYKTPLKPKRKREVIDKRDKLGFKLNFLYRN